MFTFHRSQNIWRRALLKIALMILISLSITFLACATSNSEDINQSAKSVSTPNLSGPAQTKNVLTPTRRAPTPTKRVPTPTKRVPKPTEIVLTPDFMPSFAFASTYIDNDSGALLLYLSLQDAFHLPVESTGSATLKVRVEDRDETEVFTGSFNLTESDLSLWANNFTGNVSAGFIIPMPLDEFEPSLSGSSTGTIFIDLDYGNLGSIVFNPEISNLPKAPQSEIDAIVLERFTEGAVALSNTTSTTDGWNITPIQAGCFSGIGLFEVPVEGIRIDFEIENTSDTIVAFYDTVILQGPGNLTHDLSFNSTLSSKNRLPGEKANGYLLFEDLDCNEGDYRIVFSNYKSIYLDEKFTILP